MTEAPKSRTNYPAAVLGMLAGVILGSVGFWLLWKIGFYGMVLPGAMVGLGCGAQSRAKSIPLGIASAVVAFVLCVVLEWYYRPFVADESLLYFVKNLSDLQNRTKFTMACGIFAGFWFGRGR